MSMHVAFSSLVSGAFEALGDGVRASGEQAATTAITAKNGKSRIGEPPDAEVNARDAPHGVRAHDLAQRRRDSRGPPVVLPALTIVSAVIGALRRRCANRSHDVELCRARAAAILERALLKPARLEAP
jgi:hypothetical protein